MSWDERYSTAEYVYGTEPNGFLVEHAGLLRGPVLSLAEGEGRNGVFLAGQGLTVHGVDSSAVGLAKAQALAAARGVSLHVEQADLAEFVPACVCVTVTGAGAAWLVSAAGLDPPEFFRTPHPMPPAASRMAAVTAAAISGVLERLAFAGSATGSGG